MKTKSSSKSTIT